MGLFERNFYSSFVYSRVVWVWTLLTITWFLIGVVTAQNNELTEVYVALDGSFQFQYPIDWEIDDSQEFVQLNNITEDPQQQISFNFFSPNVVNTLLADTAEPLTSAAEVLSAIRSLDTYTDILVGEVASQIDNGREVAFISAAVGAESGFATVADFGDGQYAFVISLTDLINLTQETAMFMTQVIRTFVPAGSTVLGNGGVGSGVEETTDDGELPTIPPRTNETQDTPTTTETLVPLDVTPAIITATTTGNLAATALPSDSGNTDDGTGEFATAPPVVITATPIGQGDAPTPILQPTNDPSSPSATPLSPPTSTPQPTVEGPVGNIDRMITQDDVRTQPNSTPILIAGLGELELELFDKFHNFTIEELENNAYIGHGGRFLFSQNFYDYGADSGDWFEDFGQGDAHENIVMSGQLTFIPSDSNAYETCSLAAHTVVDENDTVVRLLRVGIDNQGNAFYQDVYQGGGDNIYEKVYDLDLALNEGHHVLFVAIEGQLTIFVDGQLIAEEEPIGIRRGAYGIGLTARGAGAICEARNTWAYEVVEATYPLCYVAVNEEVNKRAEPSTNAQLQGQLRINDVAEVVAQTRDENDSRWWQLMDGSWVRHDVVIEFGGCSVLPTIEVE